MNRNLRLINKDLILRERLALDRTAMANDRTLLSFIRTSLYFAVAGLSINNLLKISAAQVASVVCWTMAVLLSVTGLFKFLQQRKKLKNSERHIGNYITELEDDMD